MRGQLAPGECDRDLLIALHRRIEPTVTAIANIHFNYTTGRHYEVVEIISVFHVDQLARSAMRYVESLRLTFCVLICPQRWDLFTDEGGPPTDMHEFLQQLGLVEHLGQFFGDVRHLAGKSSVSDLDAEVSMWDVAEKELQDVSQRLEKFVMLVDAGHMLNADTYDSLQPLVQRVLNMIEDFLHSLAEDTSLLFSTPNFVATEMLAAGDTSWKPRGSRVTVDIFQNVSGERVFNPAFMKMLIEPSAMLVQPPFSPKFHECSTISSAPPPSSVLPMEFTDQPNALVHRDISGVPDRRGAMSSLQLLQVVGRHTRLSNLFISVQVAPYLLSPPPSCGSRLVLYDPSHCLIDHNWGGYFFHMNPLPPFNLSVVYTGKPLGPGAQLPPTDVHSIHVPSMDTQWSSLVSTFKSMNHHSPDQLFVSPFAGNCMIVDRLLGTGSVKPKLLYLPINPLVAPPHEDTPNFFEWWEDHGAVLLAQLLMGITASSDMPAGMPVSSAIWLAQCSLVAGVKRLEPHGYALVHVEHTFAVFLWRPLYVEIFGAAAAEKAHSPETLRAAWQRGWQCSPHSRYLFDLEVLAGSSSSTASVSSSAADKQSLTPSGLSRAAMREFAAAPATEEVPTLRYFLETPSPARGRCGEGICECFPPYRGEMCEHIDPPRVEQSIRAVIHYVTAETERDMKDLERSLSTLWDRYNHRYDYPVVIFHEGLSSVARRRIIEASDNRIWLALLPKFKEVPAEWATPAHERARDFSVGYRAMIRWRSGPIFLEPALAGFDYAMTLDTDSYFPAAFAEDPFEVLHREGWAAAFPHLGRESASVVVNFMHYFLLYCRLKGVHARRTEMLASLIEVNFKWYQQCLMLDIEVLRLDWFRGSTYQDFFRYMDSTGGFWLHRWGNNPVRTFAVALLLEDRNVRSMDLPYAHQDFCSCGPGAGPCKWNSDRGLHTCENADVPRGIATGELAEGLLDLQPWRGTDRQKRQFAPEQIQQFVAEQMPLSY